jgi:Mannose-6-phosphate isomerase
MPVRLAESFCSPAGLQGRFPLDEKHRLANPGKVPLEIIEVQSGGSVGEDDIVRFEDTYGRK